MRKKYNNNNKTGDPSCPPSVRRAKRISRSTQEKCSARALGSEESGRETNSRTGCGRLENIQGSETVEGRGDKHHSGSSRTSSSKRYKSMEVESSIVESVGKMSEHLGMISRALEEDGKGITEENFKRIVRKDVEDSLRPTNEILKDIAEILRALVSSRRHAGDITMGSIVARENN